MVETCVFWFVLLQFSAVSSQTSTSITVGSGEKVTLPCENVIEGRTECDSTTWIVNSQSSSETEELFNLGKLRETSKSDRVNLTSDCSLVIEKVRPEDAGRYSCRQFISNEQQGRDAQIYLSVIDITQSIDTDKVNLTCSVFRYKDCRHTVEWQIKETRNRKIHPSTCSSSVSFLNYNQNSESFTCRVTDKNNNQVLMCSSKPLTPCWTETDVDKTSSTTTSTSTTTTKSNKDVNVTTTAPQNASIKDYWWVFVAAAVVVLVVVLIIGLRIRSKRTEENQTQENNNNTGDPEGSYVTISFTNTKNHRHQTTGDDSVVTYSAVRAASTDPSDPVYSTIK